MGFDASRDDFECFRCEGVCNCTSCCRKRGDTYFPTKALFDDSSQKNTTPKRTSLALRPAKPLPSSKRTFVGDVQDDWELGNDSMLESTEMDVGSSRPAKGKTPSRSYKQADPHCHQCRSRRPVYMKCKNEDTGCTSKYCVRCVKQRYPDVEFDASREDFSCFRCEETCNCNLCCRKRGDEYFTTKALLEDLDVRSQRDTAETPQSSLGPCRVIDTSLLPSTASPSSE
ncbi:hypothetical protein BDP27DRAFT_862806 [Rhodocollybia butyracea]|uniref:Zinc-finger domain-containing protein n=1 Tax=Rhodocollybia butyracea TaxID=206335 RepID=A0A9P5U6K4_9AGAR|nr:hypothetical protein BDP27DRAFT_862806 [Rhodocollybia butyracea]